MYVTVIKQSYCKTVVTGDDLINLFLASLFTHYSFSLMCRNMG